MLPCPSNIIAIYLPRKSGGFPRFWPALKCPPARERGWRPRRARYLPALVMIISVPISWKRFQSSAPCRSTRGACGVGSGEPGREPLGEPPGEAAGEAARNPSSQPPAERAEEARAAGAARIRHRGLPQPRPSSQPGGSDGPTGLGSGEGASRAPGPRQHGRAGRVGLSQRRGGRPVRGARPKAHRVGSVKLRSPPHTANYTHNKYEAVVCVYTYTHIYIYAHIIIYIVAYALLAAHIQMRVV